MCLKKNIFKESMIALKKIQTLIYAFGEHIKYPRVQKHVSKIHEHEKERE